MSNNVDINLTARTSDFESAMIRVNKSFESMASKGMDASKAFDKSLAAINKDGKKHIDDLQKSLNSLSVKSDFNLDAQKAALSESVKFYQRQFEAIKIGGEASFAEIARAAQGLNTKLLTLNAGVLKNEFQTLGVQSSASIELLKDKVVLAFEAIKNAGTSTPQDIVRAQENMVAKITELDNLLISSAQKAADAKKRAFKETQAAEIASYAAQNMQGSDAAPRLINQALAGTTFSNNLKMQMEEAAAATQLMQREMNSYAAASMQGESSAVKLTGQLQAGVGFAAQLKAQMEEAAIATKKVADADAYAIKNLGAKGDRLQGSFDTLGIKSSLNVEAEKAKIVAAFNQIKNSGVASANEIKQAMNAMKNKLEEVEKVGGGNAVKGQTNSINLLSLASIAAIAKVQILYSLVNQTMSVIGSLPSTAVDAIETFQSSMIKNAAVITSMHGGVKDIGKAYLENREYAESVQNVLVKMDAHTIASYSQLQLMNDAFVQQGVYIDTNNKKQLEGYQNVANALATISAGMSNPDMQFSQEIRGLMNGEDKATNMLFKTLQAVDPLLKEHLKEWKAIAAETGNAGYVLEKLGPLLVGFAAASGDIDSLWSTVKSTMSTIRDEVLRGGLSEGFKEIVIQMKELNKYAEENKEKIQAFLKEGFANAKIAATYMWNLGKAAAYLAEPAMWLAISAGVIKVAGSMTTLTTQITLATAGLNLLVAGLIAAAAYGGKSFLDTKQLNMDAQEVRDYAIGGKGVGSAELAKQKNYVAGFDAKVLSQVKQKFPMMNNETIANLIRNRGIELETLVDEQYGKVWTVAKFNEDKIKFILGSSVTPAKTPKAPKGPFDNKDAIAAAEKAAAELRRINESYADYLDAWDKRVAGEVKNNRVISLNALKNSKEQELITERAYAQAVIEEKVTSYAEMAKLENQRYLNAVANTDKLGKLLGDKDKVTAPNGEVVSRVDFNKSAQEEQVALIAKNVADTNLEGAKQDQAAFGKINTVLDARMSKELEIQRLTAIGRTLEAEKQDNLLHYAEIWNRTGNKTLVDRAKEIDDIKEANRLYAEQSNIRNELAAANAANAAESASMVGYNTNTGEIDTIASQVANQLAIQEAAHNRKLEMIDEEREAIMEMYARSNRSAQDWAKASGLIQATNTKRANAENDNSLRTKQIATESYRAQLNEAGKYTSVAGQLFSAFADTQDQTSRKGFEAAKDYNIAAVIMNTATAVMAQLSIPGPVGWAGAAAAAVMGAFNLAKINSTKYGGGGGTVQSAGSFNGGAGGGGGGDIGSSRGAAYMTVQESQSEVSMQRLADSVDNASIAMTKVSEGLIKFTGLLSGEAEQLTLGGINGRFVELGQGKGAIISTMMDSIKSSFSVNLKQMLTGGIDAAIKGTGSLIGKAFGIGNKYEIQGAGVSLGIEDGKFEGQSYTDSKKDGGYFSSDKYKTKYSKLDAGFAQLMIDFVKSTKQTVEESAIMMATKSNISRVDIPDMKIATAGRSVEDIQKDVENWLQSVGNAYAKTVKGLSAYAAPGEEAFATLVRLSTALQNVNEAFALVGKTLYESTLSGANKASKLQDLFGGAEQFTTKMEAYFKSMYTTAEQSIMKAAEAQRQVNAIFATEAFVGIAKPETVAAFNELRNSITDPALFAALTEIGPAFAEMMKSATEAAEKISTAFIDNATSAAGTLKNILTGSLSTDNAFEIYRQQQVAFDNALAKGQDVSQISQELLEASQVLFGSGSRYTSDFSKVRDALANQAGLEGEVTLDSVGQQLVLLSGLKQATEDGTAKLVDSIDALKKEIQELRIQQGLEAKSIVDATEGVSGVLVAGVRN